MIRIDLSPPDFIHVPQAPRIGGAPSARAPGQRVAHVDGRQRHGRGRAAAACRITLVPLDAPFHLLPRGPTFEQLDPRHYLALDARLVDLTSSGNERRETVSGVNYHTRVDVADLPRTSTRSRRCCS
jgi:hypothetical protein